MESESEDQVVYDAHINTKVMETGKKDKRILNSIMVAVLKRFQAITANRFRMDIRNVHFLPEKKYFSADISKKKPDLHILLPDWDPDTHDEYVDKIKGLKNQTEVKMPDLLKKEEKVDENISAEELLSKLNLPGQASQAPSSKPKVTEIDPDYKMKSSAKPKPNTKVESKPVSKGETQIKETVIKSIDDYNAEEEVKKLNKGDKEIPKVEIEFEIAHKKGDIRVKIHLPKEESVSDINLQLNESGFIIESPNYYWKQTLQNYHPNLKAIKVFHDSSDDGPKTSFSKSKRVLTIYLTER